MQLLTFQITLFVLALVFLRSISMAQWRSYSSRSLRNTFQTDVKLSDHLAFQKENLGKPEEIDKSYPNMPISTGFAQTFAATRRVRFHLTINFLTRFKEAALTLESLLPKSSFISLLRQSSESSEGPSAWKIVGYVVAGLLALAVAIALIYYYYNRYYYGHTRDLTANANARSAV